MGTTYNSPGGSYVGTFGPGYLDSRDERKSGGGTRRNPTDVVEFGVSRKGRGASPKYGGQPGGWDQGRNRGDLAGARAAAEDDLNARLDEIRSQYSGGGGDGGAGAAVKEALDFLNKVKGNRSAIKGTYEEFGNISGQYGKEAVEAADQVVENSEEYFEEQGQDREQFIKDEYAGAEDIVAQYAELMGAGDMAKVAAQSEVDGEQFALDEASAESSQIMAMIELEEIVFNRQALADTARTGGQNDRRAEVTDANFANQQEDAEKRLAAARAAAARAAAARRASIAARNAAIAEARAEGNYDEVKAGQYSALSYMNKNGKGIPKDRADFILGKLFNGIEAFVPGDRRTVASHYADQGLTRDELSLLSGGLDAYYDGRDSELAASGKPAYGDYRFSE